MLFEPFIKIYEFFRFIVDYVTDLISRSNSILSVVLDVVQTILDISNYVFPEILWSFIFLGIILSVLIRFFVD